MNEQKHSIMISKLKGHGIVFFMIKDYLSSSSSLMSVKGYGVFIIKTKDQSWDMDYA